METEKKGKGGDDKREREEKVEEEIEGEEGRRKWEDIRTKGVPYWVGPLSKEWRGQLEYHMRHNRRVDNKL